MKGSAVCRLKSEAEKKERAPAKELNWFRRRCSVQTFVFRFVDTFSLSLWYIFSYLSEHSFFFAIRFFAMVTLCVSPRRTAVAALQLYIALRIGWMRFPWFGFFFLFSTCLCVHVCFYNGTHKNKLTHTHTHDDRVDKGTFWAMLTNILYIYIYIVFCAFFSLNVLSCALLIHHVLACLTVMLAS